MGNFPSQSESPPAPVPTEDIQFDDTEQVRRDNEIATEVVQEDDVQLSFKDAVKYRRLNVVHHKSQDRSYELLRSYSEYSFLERILCCAHLRSMNLPEVKKPKTSAQKRLIATALEHNFVFSALQKNEIDLVVEGMLPVRAKKGFVVMKQGDPADYFYVVESGAFQVFVNDNQVRTIEAGGSFGEHALVYDAPRGATIKATESSNLFALDRVTFKSILSRSADSKNREISEALRSVPLLTILTEVEINRLIDAVVVLNFKPADKIVVKGDPATTFYIIKKGQCAVSEAEATGLQLGPGQFFGERALIQHEPRTATITAITEVEVLALDKTAFDELLGPLQQVLDRSVRDRAEQHIKSQKKVKSGSMTNHDLKDLKELAVLGLGGFGRVSLVQHSSSKDIFALKAMLKSTIVEQDASKNIMNEKEVMALCGAHPFIIRLFQTFKDSKRLYFLLEFVEGGELLSRIYRGRNNGLSNATARFYSAGILSALEHIHALNIIHRDLKPENILIDKVGYPKLVDFGLAKVVVGKTYTTCGTLDYMAPEIILGRGHNTVADYWALGILIHEMRTGRTPFGDSSQAQSARKIVVSEPELSNSLEKEAKDLLVRLLAKNVQQRLGNQSGGVQDIRRHAWFTDFNFQKFQEKTMTPPWVPQLKSATDASRYDPSAFAQMHAKAKVVAMDTSAWDKDF